MTYHCAYCFDDILMPDVMVICHPDNAWKEYRGGYTSAEIVHFMGCFETLELQYRNKPRKQSKWKLFTAWMRKTAALMVAK